MVYVYKVQGDTLAVLTNIKVADRVNNLVLVNDGIKADDHIVAKGVAKLRNNPPVLPQSVPFDSVATTLDVESGRRRVGNACVCQCSCRWWAFNTKNQNTR